MESPTAGAIESHLDKSGAMMKRLPVALYLFFFLSGFSGLIYEVVWLRMLTRTLGSTIYATSTILSVFMGGLGLGSLLFGRFADRVKRILLLYTLMEAGIGVSALLSLGMNSWPIRVYREIYALAGDSRAALVVGQILLTAMGLLVPTVLMGGTLPVLCSYGVRRSGSIGRVAGTLYAFNTMGAMVGVLIAGFVLIGWIGETRTIEVGAGINALVAMFALVMSMAAGLPAANRGEPVVKMAVANISKIYSRRVRETLLFYFAVSGFVSLALEIVWSRMLALYVGTSIYAFSSMLVVMLGGIGLGGWIGHGVERWKDPLLALARVEMAVGVTAALSLATFADMRGLYIVVPPLLVVGPTSLLLGIAFPITVRCYTEHAESLGRRVGELYAWNTVGCVLGSLAGGFLLVPSFGTAHTGALLAGLAVLASLTLFLVHPKGLRSFGAADAGLFVAAMAAIFCIGEPYFEVIRTTVLSGGYQVFEQVEEAPATTVAAGGPNQVRDRRLLVNGVGVTVLVTGNKLMADLPEWLVDSPKNTLVICLGMGTTFRSAVVHKTIDVTAVELVPAVPRFMHYFHSDAQEVMAQPNAHVVIDDGRNYLLMHPRQFDTITIDPAPPLYSAGTVNLYTEEFCRLCRSRLKPGGAMSLWIPVGPVSEVKMIMRTFAEVFPHVSVWGGWTNGGFLLIGTEQPVSDVAGRVRRGLEDPATVADLTEWDDSCATPAKVMSLYICDRDAILKFTSNAATLTDDYPYSEFPLWRMNWRDPADFVTLDAAYLRNWLSQN